MGRRNRNSGVIMKRKYEGQLTQQKIDRIYEELEICRAVLQTAVPYYNGAECTVDQERQLVRTIETTFRYSNTLINCYEFDKFIFYGANRLIKYIKAAGKADQSLEDIYAILGTCSLRGNYYIRVTNKSHLSEASLEVVYEYFADCCLHIESDMLMMESEGTTCEPV